MNKNCKKCIGFKTKQGTGIKGECRMGLPTAAGWPEVTELDYCITGFKINPGKYNPSGRKIYTKKDTNGFRPATAITWDINTSPPSMLQKDN